MNVSPTTAPIAAPDLASLPYASLQSGSSQSDPSGFSGALESAIGEVESSQQAAQSAAMEFLAAGKGDVHNVALAAQRAELATELFQQVKNKFVQAYQEIMKTPM